MTGLSFLFGSERKLIFVSGLKMRSVKDVRRKC